MCNVKGFTYFRLSVSAKLLVYATRL